MNIAVRMEALTLARLLLESRSMPIKLRAPDGSVVDGDFNGYYDLRPVGGGIWPSIGYPDGQGGLTHGWLRDGWALISQVPSFEEWAAEEAAARKLATVSNFAA